MASLESAVLAAVAVLAGVISVALILALSPWLKAYALARPNARSSHQEPTPQGGGAAVIVATLAAAWLGVALIGAIALGAPGEFLALGRRVAFVEPHVEQLAQAPLHALGEPSCDDHARSL